MRSIIKLDNMNDHLKLVPLLLERFEAKKSKDSHVFMFVKELLKKTESRFSAAECGDLAIMAGNYQKTKQQAIDKPTESNAKKKSKKKSKKEKLEQKKKVDDLFGVAEAGEYDHYEDQYDDDVQVTKRERAARAGTPSPRRVEEIHEHVKRWESEPTSRRSPP